MVQGLVDIDDIQALLFEIVHHEVQWNSLPLPTSAIGGPPPRVVDEDFPHGPGRRREQEGPVRGPVEDRFSQEPDHGLVHHGGVRERMVGPLPLHQAGGDPAQLVVDQRDEFTPGPLVTGPGPTKDQREFVRLPG